MNSEEKYKSILRQYLPISAVDSIYTFVVANNVQLKIVRQRKTKLGDYRRPLPPRQTSHRITINGDLKPFFFLLVLLHEMAHLNTFLRYGWKSVQDHGAEWQDEYRKLMIQYFSAGHFPPAAYPIYERYVSSLPLNATAGRELELLLRQCDADGTVSPELLLQDIPLGSLFRIASSPQRLFRVDEKRRTRFLCTELVSGRKFTVSGLSPVVLETRHL